MAAKKRATDDVVPGALSRFQRFTVERMRRSDVKGCPYNPRTIDAKAKRKLKAYVERAGLLEPLVVNRRTMHLVGGHQRISALDTIEGRDDYELDFSVVDLTDAEEREAVVALNAPGLQGEWSLPMLANLFGDRDMPVKFDAVGFEAADIEALFDGSGVTLDIFDGQRSRTVGTVDGSDSTAQAEHENVVERGESEKTRAKLVVVCASSKERVRLARALGIVGPEETRHVDARVIFALVKRARGIKVAPASPPATTEPSP